MQPLRHFIKRSASVIFFFLLCMSRVVSQHAAYDSSQRALPAPLGVSASVETNSLLPPVEPLEVIKRFVSTEGIFRETMRQYSFKRDVILQTIGPDGRVTGEYIRNSQFILDDRDGRVERVLYHPKSTIREMKITKEDIQDLACAQLFGFEITDLSRYDFAYKGRETVNSLETFVIEVRPTESPDSSRMRERFFAGRIWVDAHSFQIVRMRGITLPQGKQRFPVFETSRGQIAGSELLFPVATFADDTLHFSNRDVHYRITVRYYDYKRFSSKVSIVEIDQPEPEN